MPTNMSGLLQALLPSLCDNLPSVMTYLLDSFVLIGPQLTVAQHQNFIALLLASPGTATLSSLASHLSLVSAPMHFSTQAAESSGAAAPRDAQQEEIFISQRKTTVIVQSALAHFVADLLMARITAAPIKIASLLPDGSATAQAELAGRPEVLLPPNESHPPTPIASAWRTTSPVRAHLRGQLSVPHIPISAPQPGTVHSK